LTRAPGEDVGTYAINQGTLSVSSTALLGQKYDIVFFDSNLTITPRPITVVPAVKWLEFRMARSPDH